MQILTCPLHNPKVTLPFDKVNVVYLMFFKEDLCLRNFGGLFPFINLNIF